MFHFQIKTLTKAFHSQNLKMALYYFDIKFIKKALLILKISKLFIKERGRYAEHLWLLNQLPTYIPPPIFCVIKLLSQD